MPFLKSLQASPPRLRGPQDTLLEANAAFAGIQEMVICKIKIEEFPFVVQWLTNPTSSHEVAGSIPGLAQWLKAPALL